MTATTTATQPPSLTASERTTVFALVGAGHTMSHIYILALPPLFALIKADLDISYAALGLLVTMFHVATGSMQVPAGFLVDRFGARATLIVGLFACAGAMGAIGLANSYWLMVGLATVAGIGNSVFHPADYAILAASVDDRHLGKAFSFHLLAGNLGFAAAPILMVTLATLWDWRTAVVLVGAAGIAVAVAMLLFGSNLTATSDSQQAKKQSGNSSGSRALTSPAMLTMLVFFILIAVANTGIQTFSVTVLTTLHGVTLGAANTALTLYLTAGFLGIAAGGFVADRLRKPVVVVVACMLVAGLAIFTVGVVAASVVVLFAGMAIGGAAVGVMRPARDMMVNAIAPPGATGKAFGFVGTGLSAGGAVAPIAIGWMIDAGASDWVFTLIVAFLLMSIGSAVAVHRMTEPAQTGTAARS